MDTFFGAINNICVYNNGDRKLLLIANGGILSIYNFKNTKMLKKLRVFKKQSIHKISVDENNILVCGGCEVALIEMIHHNTFLLNIKWNYNTTDWIRSGKIFSCRKSTNCNKQCDVVVLVLSHHDMIYIELNNGTIIRRLTCTDESIIYSADLFGTCLCDLKCAMGSVFQEIHIWHPIAYDDTRDKKCTFEQKFLAHSGSVFSVKWIDKNTLISTSDDRTVVKWQYKNAQWHKQFQCWGHNARVWCCDGNNEIIVSGSEDCTVKVWNGQSGQLLRNFVGQEGPIWSVAYDDVSNTVISGSGDNTTRIYQLSSIMFPRIMNNQTLEYEYRHIIQKKVKVNNSGIDNNKLSEASRLWHESKCQMYIGSQLNNNDFIIDLIYLNRHEILATSAKGELIVYDNIEREREVKRQRYESNIYQFNQNYVLDLEENACTSALCSYHNLIAIGTKNGNVKIVQRQHSNNFKLLFSTKVDIRSISNFYWCSTKGNIRLVVTSAVQNVNVFIWNSEELVLQKTHSLTIESKKNRPAGSILIEYNSKEILLYALSGNISALYAYELLSNGKVNEVDRLYHIHSRGITDIKMLEHFGVCTFGADGNIVRFLLFEDENQILQLKKQRTYYCSNISLPLIMYQDEETKHVFVLGCNAHECVVWNYSLNVEIIRFDCGGRKRPFGFFWNNRSDFSISFSLLRKGNFACYQICENTSPRILGVAVHGTLINGICVATSNEYKLIGIVGEDNKIRLYNLKQDFLHDIDNLSETPDTLKTIDICKSVDRNGNDCFIIFVGGRSNCIQCHQIEIKPNYRVMCLAAQGGNLGFRFNKNKSDDLDVRITCLKATKKRNENSFIIFVGTSSGFLSVYELNRNGKLTELLLHSESEYPVISMNLNVKFGYLIVGRTNGVVSIYDINDFLIMNDDYPKELNLIYKNKLHDGGVNCISSTFLASQNIFIVISGGDDQNVVLVGCIDNTSWLAPNVYKGVHSSSLKGLTCFTNRRTIVTSGCDQRIRFWNYVFNELSTQIDLKLVKTYYSEVGDISTHTIIDSNIIVIGMGLQIINCD